MRVRRQATATPVVALLCALAVLSGCAAPDDDGPPTALVLMPALEGRFTDAAEVLQSRLEEAGWSVEVAGTDGDIPSQVQSARDALDGGLDALVIWPIDGTALTPVVEGAPAATRIIALGGLVYDTAALDGFVGFDAAQAGAAQARTVLDALPDGPADVEIFAGSPDVAGTAPSYAAIMAGLEPAIASGRVVIRSGETALDDVTTLRGNAETAASRMSQLLRETYDGELPDAVIATSDEIARGVASVFLDAGAEPGPRFPVVTGRGAQLEALAALASGRQYSTLLEDPRELAGAAAGLLLGESAPDTTIDNGAAAVPAVLVPGITVLAGDIDAVVVGSGYWSRAQVDEAIAEFAVTPAPSPHP